MSELSGHIDVTSDSKNEDAGSSRAPVDKIGPSCLAVNLQFSKKEPVKGDHFIKDVVEEVVIVEDASGEELEEQFCPPPEEFNLSKEDRLKLEMFSLTVGVSVQRLFNDILTCLEQEGSLPT